MVGLHPLPVTAVPAQAPPSTIRHFAEASFSVPAPIERVFPLFDPVNEAKWVPGWSIEPIEPVPFRMEKNAVFLTAADGHTAVWTVVRFDPALHEVEYLVVVPGFQQRWVAVRCIETADGTEVTVSYTVTALGPPGGAALRRYDEDFIRAWREPVTLAALEVDLAAP
jgi:Polyketide cyclase / dehydrase and lipid transport